MSLIIKIKIMKVLKDNKDLDSWNFPLNIKGFNYLVDKDNDENEEKEEDEEQEREGSYKEEDSYEGKKRSKIKRKN